MSPKGTIANRPSDLLDEAASVRYLRLMTNAAAELHDRVAGVVGEPGQPGYDEEVSGFNAAVVHRPAVAVGAASTADIVEAVRFAKRRGWRVGVQSTGHGAALPFDTGLLVNTRRLDHVRLDAAAREAVAGAGARWGALVAAGAPHALAPITGSSPGVGVVGFLLGGGIGPLVRSHGFGSDHLLGATLVTGTGEVISTSAAENPEVLWALRGGGPRLGIVTEVRVGLVDLPALYAGSLFFEEAHLEAALRAWIAWTAGADPRVSSSAAIVRFPSVEAVPPAMRGRLLLTVRFAFPGEAAEGRELAAPLRSSAPVHLDVLGPLPIAEVARIFNDPSGPLPAWASGALLARADQDLASVLLRHAGPGASCPFVAVELRQLGGAAARDVPGGSAVGGRGAAFTFNVVGSNPALFASVFPDAEGRLVADLTPWLSPETNGNFGRHPSARTGAAPVLPAKVADLRRRCDPDGLFV